MKETSPVLEMKEKLPLLELFLSALCLWAAWYHTPAGGAHQGAGGRVIPGGPEAEGGKKQLEERQFLLHLKDRRCLLHRQEATAAIRSGNRITAAAMR